MGSFVLLCTLQIWLCPKEIFLCLRQFFCSLEVSEKGMLNIQRIQHTFKLGKLFKEILVLAEPQRFVPPSIRTLGNDDDVNDFLIIDCWLESSLERTCKRNPQKGVGQCVDALSPSIRLNGVNGEVRFGLRKFERVELWPKSERSLTLQNLTSHSSATNLYWTQSSSTKNRRQSLHSLSNSWTGIFIGRAASWGD